MKTTKLHTFEEILTRGITVDGQQEPIHISAMFIPKIQRSYAQGRKAENEIRKDFLDDIFDTLTAEEGIPLELSFLFGSKQPLINGTSDGFELLDGQQRTTTLFLLYWYINTRESEKLPDFLGLFTYETRDTSTDFLRNISRQKFDLNKEKPSKVLKANKWFTDEFNCDPTICAMLNMMDEIHLRYNQIGRNDLVSKLNRLQFYVLLLEKFDMNDELYIKMNSRGLSLVPFENFKASVVRYMKKHPQNVYGDDDTANGKMPYWLDFVSKMDAKWIDIFWQYNLLKDNNPIKDEIEINDHEIGCRYMRFLNRYFFTKAAILEGTENKKLLPLPTFFYKECESAEAEKRLSGWSNYEELFKQIEESQKGISLPSTHYPVFSAIEKILDVYYTHKGFILGCIQNDPYRNTFSFDVLKRMENPQDYTFSHRVIFAATTEFIEALPDGYDFNSQDVRDNFKRMIRIAHNVIENTLIETDIAAVGVIKSLSEIINYPGATNQNFYYSLANNELRSRNNQLKDEKEKAAEMFDDKGAFIKDWEDAFIKAENHPFFKGSITFFFTPGVGDYNAFLNRYNVVKDLFDKNGIAEDYRKDEHILIRALLSCFNYWESGLKNRYFTENAEKEKHLKSLVTSNEKVREMFCDFFKLTGTTISDYLKDVVKNASCSPNEPDTSFIMLYRRLINDEHASAIYDDVSDREQARGCFRIQNNRSYIILIPGKWYDQLVLDTERNIIIPTIVNYYGFDYKFTGQERQLIGALNDYWGWCVEITKSISVNGNNYRLVLTFNEYKNVVFHILGNNYPALMELFQVNEYDEQNGIVYPEYVHYQYNNDIDAIKAVLNKIEIELSEIH